MKQKWEVKKLGDVCEVIAGQSPEGKYYNNTGNGLPFYQGKKEFTEKFIAKPSIWTACVTKVALSGDVLMSVRAPVGPVNFSTDKVCIGRGLAALRANKLIDKEYLFNFLLMHENKIVGNAGAVFNSISKAQIESLQIPLPPLSEQQRIVAILDEAFTAIAKAKENAEKNLANAREVFESYLQSVFVNPGDGWEIRKLGDICKISDGTHFSPKNSDSGEYKYITAKNIKPYHIDLSKLTYISEEDHKQIFSRCPVKKGDVLYIKDGATAGIAALNCLDEEFSLLSSVAVINPFEQILNTFLVHYMNSKIGKKNFLGYIDGAAITRLTLIKLKNVIISFPPIPKQKRIVANLDALSEQTKKLEAIYQQKLTDLEELKKSLLQKAFNGELTGSSL